MENQFAKKEKDFFKIASGKSCVSVPMLQSGLKIGYSEAKDLVRFAISRRWIEKEPEGIFYKIRCLCKGGAPMNQEEYSFLFSSIEYVSFKMLEYMFKKNHAAVMTVKREFSGKHLFEDPAYNLDRLREFGVLLFDGKEYSINICKEDYERLLADMKKSYPWLFEE